MARSNQNKVVKFPVKGQNYSQLPEALKQNCKFVVLRSNDAGELIPYQPGAPTKRASLSGKKFDGTFQAALDDSVANGGQIALYLKDSDIVVVRVLEGAENGELTQHGQAVLAKFPADTYAEIYQDSLQILGRGCTINGNSTEKKVNIVTCSAGLSFSGVPFESSRTEIRNCQVALNSLHIDYFSSYSKHACEVPGSVDLNDLMAAFPNTKPWQYLAAELLKSYDKEYDLFLNYCKHVRIDGETKISGDFNEDLTKKIWKSAAEDSELPFGYLLYRARKWRGFRVQSVTSQSELIEEQEVHTAQAPFPFHALGPTLGNAALRCHEIIQAPPDLCGLSFLSVANFLTQGHVDCVVDGRTIQTSMWFFPIVESGDRKSAVDAIALKAVRLHESAQKESYEIELKDHKIDLDAWEATRSKIKKDKSLSHEESREALRELGARPEPPLYPDLLCDDITYDGLYRSLRNGQPAQGIVSDEGGVFFGGWSNQKDQLLRTVANLCSAHERGVLKRSRAGDADGPESIRGKRIMISLSMQPIVAKQILSNPIYKEQGFFGRGFISLSSETQGRAYQAVDVLADTAIQKFLKRCRKILKTEKTLKANSRNELEPEIFDLDLDIEAKKLYVDFHNTVQAEIPKGKKYSCIKSFASKAHDNALRTAASLNFFDRGFESIDVDHMQHAIDLTHWGLEERLRIENLGPDLGEESERSYDADQLLAWIKAYLQKTKLERDSEFVITRPEILQYGPNRFRNKKALDPIIATLLERSQLRVLKGPPIKYMLNVAKNSRSADPPEDELDDD